MKNETKNVKKLLKELFPQETFSVRFETATSYVDSSDKIKIQCPQAINTDIVIQTLRQYVSNIVIYKKGTVVSISNNETPKLRFSNGTIVDMDMVEFIEVE